MDRGVGTKPVYEGYVAIGWSELGDLAAMSPTREAFKIAVHHAYPHAKLGSIPVQASVLYRFVHEAQPQEIVVYPSKVERLVNIGRIDGPYQYDPVRDPAYPNTRDVLSAASSIRSGDIAVAVFSDQHNPFD